MSDDLVERVASAIRWCDIRREDRTSMTQARAAIAAIEAAGYVVVPREPTEKMLVAADTRPLLPVLSHYIWGTI